MQKLYIEMDKKHNPVAEIVVMDNGVQLSYGHWNQGAVDMHFFPEKTEFVTFEDEPMLQKLYTTAWNSDELNALVHSYHGGYYDIIQIENDKAQ